MKPRPTDQLKLTHGRLLEVLHYDPSTGFFTWLKTLSPKGLAGSRAGCVRREYRVVTVDGECHLEHRVAWFYVKGKWPDEIIDHLDSDGHNNAFDNLREATYVINNQNRRKLMGHNTSGFVGAIPVVVNGVTRYTARISYPGKRNHYLGRFDTPEQACAAYMKAKAELHEGFVA